MFSFLSPAKVNSSKEEVANASERAQEIIEVLEPLVESFNKKEDDVRKKMAEWPGLVKRLESLLTNVTDANDTAHDAIARGEKTLEQAKDMLERLKVSACVILRYSAVSCWEEGLLKGVR